MAGFPRPEAGVIDTFDRVNEGPPPSANWTTGFLSANGLKVSTNTVVQNAAGSCDGYWSAQDFGPGIDLYVSNITGWAVSGDRYAVYGRLTVVTPKVGYVTRCNYNGTTWDVTLNRLDNAVHTQLGATDTRSSSVTAVGLRAEDSNIEGYYDDGSGWTLVAQGSYTDATYAAPGKVGLLVSGATTTKSADNFGGGTLLQITKSTITYPTGHFGPF